MRWIAIALFTVGCSESHGVGDAGRDAGADDMDACLPTPCPGPPPGCEYVPTSDPCACGVLRCDPEVDAGVCMAGFAVEPDVVCFDGGDVPTIDIVVHEPDGCFCGETIACTASQEGTTIDVDVRADTCGDLCDGCFHDLRGSCTLTGVRLTPSPVYDVRINGHDAIGNVSWGGPMCWTPAGVVGSGLVCDWPGEAPSGVPSSQCVPTTASPGQAIVVSATRCMPDCFAVESGCEITIAAGNVSVTPLVRDCECPSCGACEPSDCYEKTIYCTLPPLESGVHQIRLGNTVTTLVVSDSGTGNLTCAGDL